MPSFNVACEYHHHDSGIHEFVFFESSRLAINEYFRVNGRIVSETPPEQTSLFLIDITRSGILPMTYFIERMRFAETKYPHRLTTRVAILYQDPAILSILDHIIRILTGQTDTVRFFDYHQREEAIGWLRVNLHNRVGTNVNWSHDNVI